jgi:hypothetical protein
LTASEVGILGQCVAPVHRVYHFRIYMYLFPLQNSSIYCQARVCACGHVLSCQALNVATSQGPSSNDAYPALKALGCGCRGPGVPQAGAGDKADWVDRW